MRCIIIILLMFALAGCGILSPATELMVINETGSALEVLAAPCRLEVELFAVLDDGESHVEQVPPGCWRVEGWTDDGRFGSVEKEIADGELAKFPFRPESAT